MNKLYIIIFLVFTSFAGLNGQSEFKQLDINKSEKTTKDYTIKKTFRGIADGATSTQKFNLSPIDITVKNTNLKSTLLNERGLPSYIRGHLPNHKNFKSFADQSAAYLQAAKPHMKIADDKLQFSTTKLWSDKHNTTHQKMTQSYKGIPIYGAEIILHGDKDGRINMLNGNYFTSTDISANTKEKLTEEEAKSIVKSKLKNYKENLNKQLKSKKFNLDFDQWTTELLLYPINDELKLSYHIEVYANLGDFRTFIVDAQDGSILDEFSNICSIHGHHHGVNHNHSAIELISGPESANAFDLFDESRSINTYSANGTFFLIDISRNMFDGDESRLPDDANGVIGTLDAQNTSPQNDNFRYDDVKSNNNSWGNSPEGVSAHYNAGRAYEYFEVVHGRSSTNNEGANILSFVNVADEDGGSMENAFWNGLAIWYGNGGRMFLPLARALDVAGHEITHGVVQDEANLTYRGESGALNESFADIFGTMIERENWAIGEQVLRSGGALRNMADPHNGARQGDWGGGFQPKHYDERFTGREDNGGVHINSGIPNHAFYLLAQEFDNDISKPEQIYYRALTTYLTKSAQFIDARNAVVQSALDLYGEAEANAAARSFDQVGVLAGDGGSYQEDVEINEGEDFIVYTPTDESKLVLIDSELNVLADPLSATEVLSKPSVADAGDDIVFVGKDKQIHNVIIDWANLTFEESVISNDPIWRNAIISKNGRWVAAMEELDGTDDNEIIIVDLEKGIQKTFTLYNPTFTEGVSTGEVLYADAMEFDFTNHTLIYDAVNRVTSTTGAEIEYWDIGFLEFWDTNTGDFAEGNIEKLFSALPEGINVGNPTFSKNSPHIIALDFLDENESDGWEILGVNIETGDVETIKTNSEIGFPNYSRDDKLVVHNGVEDFGVVSPLHITEVDDSKIKNGGQTFRLVEDGKWGVWFSNGMRQFTSSIFETDVIADQLKLYPNPAIDMLNISFIGNEQKIEKLEVFDLVGKRIIAQNYQNPKLSKEIQLNVSVLESGMYSVVCHTSDQIFSTQFVKD